MEVVGDVQKARPMTPELYPCTAPCLKRQSCMQGIHCALLEVAKLHARINSESEANFFRASVLGKRFAGYYKGLSLIVSHAKHLWQWSLVGIALLRTYITPYSS
jgi:hypothetical protein